jgi:hypothetical protein
MALLSLCLTAAPVRPHGALCVPKMAGKAPAVAPGGTQQAFPQPAVQRGQGRGTGCEGLGLGDAVVRDTFRADRYWIGWFPPCGQRNGRRAGSPPAHPATGPNGGYSAIEGEGGEGDVQFVMGGREAIARCAFGETQTLGGSAVPGEHVLTAFSRRGVLNSWR